MELGSTVELGNILIRLNMDFNDGRGGITRYFYEDTLEEAPEFDELDRFEGFMEKAECYGCSQETLERSALSLETEARHAYLQRTGAVRLHSMAAEQCAQAVTMPEPDELEKY